MFTENRGKVHNNSVNTYPVHSTLSRPIFLKALNTAFSSFRPFWVGDGRDIDN